MSLALLDDILLRVESDPNLTAKGSALTWTQEDTNFIIIRNAISELSEVEVGGVDAYNAGTEYSLTTPATYVTYNGNTWQYVNAIPSTGVTPGTDGTRWSLSSNGIFSHQQNTDTKLNEGGANEVSASEIRTFIDSDPVQEANDYTDEKPEAFILACSDETTAITATTNKIKFRLPYAFTVTSVRASLSTAQTSGSIFTVDIHESGTTILSTKITMDNGEKTSTTAATAPVVSDSSLANDAEITIDVDQIGDGTAKGLKVYIIGHQ